MPCDGLHVVMACVEEYHLHITTVEYEGVDSLVRIRWAVNKY